MVLRSSINGVPVGNKPEARYREVLESKSVELQNYLQELDPYFLFMRLIN